MDESRHMSWIMIMGKRGSLGIVQKKDFCFLLFYLFYLFFFFLNLFKGTWLWVKIIFALLPFSFCSLGPLSDKVVSYTLRIKSSSNSPPVQLVHLSHDEAVICILMPYSYIWSLNFSTCVDIETLITSI